MAEKVLFSPIGTTDPYRDDYEGPMLHILRHHNPSIIYLFLTREMCKLALDDDRYRRAIKRQAKNLGRDPEAISIIIIESDISDPSNFNAFSEPYKAQFKRIVAEHNDAEILINVSSGTPQMIAMSCLLAAADYLGKSYHCIQVLTPVRTSGAKSPYMKEYCDGDIDNLIDNLSDAVNRCQNPDIMSFISSMRREQLIKLIERYDYAGAAQLVLKYPFVVNDQTRRWIQHMELRVRYETQKAQEQITLDDQKRLDPYPVKNDRVKPIFEYFLVAHVKYLRQEWSDFLLRISPLMTELIRFYIQDRLHFPLDRMVEKTDRGFQLIRYRIERVDKELLDYLDQEFKGRFTNSYVMLSNLLPILKYAMGKQCHNVSASEIVYVKFDSLRKVEEDLRNAVAHQMVQVNDNWAKEQTNQSFKEIYKELESLIGLVMGNDFGAGWRNFPNSINPQLINMIDQA